ncbi:site-specific integrase [Sphingomonas sp. BIUV-7]|uniref:Site-specific integrase n=1 Tax=Sphingomonas natans TaxID=3063330 RepID=A0ABT8Y9Q5_9SPHN|nr:site-specific integrase [Sphingomonas sp. BIUV-7]MDO6414390.1 site-specific integrase [Sphingomonas sp. BIUV-7]
MSEEAPDDRPSESQSDQLPVLVEVQPTLPEILHAKIERAAYYARAARSPATRRAYESDWAIFVAWCEQHDAVSMPASPDVVAVFASDQADSGLNPSTINRRVAAIGHFHRAAGHPAPTALPNAGMLAKVMTGIRNEKGRKKNRKSPADAAALRNMLAEIKGDGLRAIRDRAVLAVGMAAALRRSELVALTENDVQMVAQGLKIFIEQSKTDQAREGDEIGVPEGTRIRPKALLLAWMAVAGLLEPAALGDDGRAAPLRPLFVRLTKADQLTGDAMSDKSIARLVKKYAAAAGYDPRLYSGHSLRSGFLTEGAGQGATIFKLQEVSRHKTVQILSDYVRDADRFNNHAGERFL